MCQKFAANLELILHGCHGLQQVFPGLVAFFVVPLVLYKLYPPELKKTEMLRKWLPKN
jgi:DASS family divalent anion:Na+ symporter